MITVVFLIENCDFAPSIRTLLLFINVVKHGCFLWIKKYPYDSQDQWINFRKCPCPGRGIPQIRRIEDMLDGITRTRGRNQEAWGPKRLLPPQRIKAPSGKRRASGLAFVVPGPKSKVWSGRLSESPQRPSAASPEGFLLPHPNKSKKHPWF